MPTFFENVTLYTNKARGFAGKTNQIKSQVFWDSELDHSESRNGNATLAASSFLGATLVTCAALVDPVELATLLAANPILGFGSAGATIASWYITGGLLLGIPALYSFLKSIRLTIIGCLEAREDFGRPCDALELAQKFITIFSDPIVSVLCCVAQAFYALASIALALFCCIPKTQEHFGLKGFKGHMSDVGTAYLDMVAHLTSAALSLFINAIVEKDKDYFIEINLEQGKFSVNGKPYDPALLKF